MLTQRALILCKVESTSAKGDDTTPTTTSNAILAYDIALAPMGEKLERNPFRSSLGQIAPLIGKKWAELTFTTELKGSATAGTAPREGALFEACAFTMSTTTTCVTYGLQSTPANMKTATIWVNIDGLQHKLTYCVGNLRMLFEAGQTAKCEWTIRGEYAVCTASGITTATFDAASLAVPVLSSVFSIGAWSCTAQALELNLNNVLAEKPDVNDANGIKGFEVVNRNIMGSFNPEAVTTTGASAFATWASRSSGTMSIVLPGAAAGNTVTITGTALYFDSVGYGDRGGIRTLEIPFTCATSAAAGDDEIKIVIT